MVIMMTLFDEEQISKNHDATIRREEREQAIANLVYMCKKMNGSPLDVIELAIANYKYSEKEAQTLVQKYWDETPITINMQIKKEK